jgi:uncharacterized membrane protein (DUF441 family)
MSADLQSFIILVFILALGFFSKNQAIQIAAALILVLKLIPGFGNTSLTYLNKNGIRLGVIILTIGVFSNIGLNKVSFSEVSEAIFTYRGWIAIIVGLIVTVIATQGVELMVEDPHITAFLIIGVIVGVAFFKGTPVGPLIGGGITAVIFMAIEKIF